jgi:tetratricopeptide (TPR) repeat protein
VAEAYRETGESYYRDGNYKQAKERFELALAKQRDNKSPAIYHKLAWCYYRLKQTNQAVTAMKRAVEYAQRDKEKSLSIREEALRDLALFMAESGDVQGAIDYFSKMANGDDSYMPKLLEKLAKELERTVQYEKSLKVHETILNLYPKDEIAFRSRVRLFEIDLRSERYNQALERIKDIEVPMKSAQQETQAARNSLRTNLRRTAVLAHDQYRKEGGGAIKLAIAERFYQRYLEILDKTSINDEMLKDRNEIKMYLAEVKRELKKPKEAAMIYRQVLREKDPRFAKEAGLLWVSSLTDALRELGQTKRSEPTEVELEFVEAVTELSNAVPDSKEAIAGRLKVAQLLAGYESRKKDAAKISEKLWKEHPGTTEGVTAARLQLQLSDDESAIKTADEMRGVSPLLKADAKEGGKLAAMITDVDRRVRAQKISKLRTDKKYADLAREFEQIAVSGGNLAGESTEKAFQAAISNYAMAGDPQGITRVYSAWVAKYPKSAGQAKDSLTSAGTQLLIQGMVKEAAELIESISHQTSAVLYEAMSMDEEAIQQYTKGLKAG